MYNKIVFALRAILASFTGLVVIWSYYWFCTRPLRYKQELGGRTEVVMLHWGGREEDEIVRSLCNSFESQHPNIRINRINANADYGTKLQTMIAGGDPPDLFFMNAFLVPHYVGRDALLNIEPFLQEDRANGNLPFDYEDMYSNTLDSFRYDGRIMGQGDLYGLPTSFTPLGFYYNKDIFDELGIEYPTDDWTWDEFAAKAKAIADHPISKKKGYYGANFAIWELVMRPYLWTYGLDYFKPGLREMDVTNPEVIEKLERIYNWRNDPANGRMMVNSRSGVSGGGDLFDAGKVGMSGPSGRWSVVTYRKIEGLNWEFAQLPKGTEHKNLLFVGAWCISKRSKHPKESWLVAKHFATPEAQAINSRFGLGLPTLRSTAEGPDFCDNTLLPHRNDLYLRAAEGAMEAQWPVDTTVNTYLSEFLTTCMVNQKITVKEAMEAVEKEWVKEHESPLRRTDFPLMPWSKIRLCFGLALVGVMTVVVFRWWRGRPSSFFFREEIAGLFMISPWFLGLVIFTAGPMIVSLLLAFTKWSGLAPLGEAQWVGLGNWVETLRDPQMIKSFKVTLYYVVLMVPIGQAASLAVACLMNSDVKGINFFRSLWYLPSVLTGVGMAVLWLWVFDAEHGLFNQILNYVLVPLGGRAPEWFAKDSQTWAVPAFVIMSLWGVGGGMLIYLAGLNAIPKTLYEAAEIDGAGWGSRFVHITLPMLSPVILFNLIMSIIGSFQIFTSAYIITGGGVDDSTRFYVLYLFNKSFQEYEMGYGSAMAWILFVIILVLTLLTMWISKKHVHYEGLRL